MQAKGKSSSAPLSIGRTRRECRWEARLKKTALDRSDISSALRFLCVVRNTLTLPLSSLLLRSLSGHRQETDNKGKNMPMRSKKRAEEFGSSSIFPLAPRPIQIPTALPPSLPSLAGGSRPSLSTSPTSSGPRCPRCSQRTRLTRTYASCARRFTSPETRTRSRPWNPRARHPSTSCLSEGRQCRRTR